MSKNNKSGILIGAAAIAALAFYFASTKKTTGKGNTSFVTDKKKLDNITILLKEMNAKGITNHYTQAAILSIISKESGFIPQSENLNYTAAQIQKVFGLSESEAKELAHNPKALANRVYGGKGGNAPDEGYKYRGMGFVKERIEDEQILYNQVTFKNTYKKLGEQTGLDLENNPELLLNPVDAAKVAIQYFINGINEGKKLGKLAQYNATGINDFKNLKDAVGAIYNINAGWGSSQKKLLADVTGGRKKAFAVSDSLYKLTKAVA